MNHYRARYFYYDNGRYQKGTSGHYSCANMNEATSRLVSSKASIQFLSERIAVLFYDKNGTVCIIERMLDNHGKG